MARNTIHDLIEDEAPMPIEAAGRPARTSRCACSCPQAKILLFVFVGTLLATLAVLLTRG